jgi:hypothetical protein
MAMGVDEAGEQGAALCIDSPATGQWRIGGKRRLHPAIVANNEDGEARQAACGIKCIAIGIPINGVGQRRRRGEQQRGDELASRLLSFILGPGPVKVTRRLHAGLIRSRVGVLVSIAIDTALASRGVWPKPSPGPCCRHVAIRLRACQGRNPPQRPRWPQIAYRFPRGAIERRPFRCCRHFIGRRAVPHAR